MSGLGYKPCLADSNLWLNPELSNDGAEYYLYILYYVGDINAVHNDSRPDLDRIDQLMKLK